MLHLFTDKTSHDPDMSSVDQAPVRFSYGQSNFEGKRNMIMDVFFFFFFFVRVVKLVEVLMTTVSGFGVRRGVVE